MAQAKKKIGKPAAKPAPSAGKKMPQKKGKTIDPQALIDAARAEAFTDESPQRAFAHFRPLAEEVPAENLAVFTSQPLLMRANIKTALAAIEPHLGAAVSALRDPRLSDVFELPSLVMALDFAASRVPVAKLSAGDIEKMLAEGAPWRELMLSFLEVASHPLLGLLPRERVAAVRAGSGKLDKARDFAAIPGLFNEFKEGLADKHPFPKETIERLGTLGEALLKQVRPGNAAVEVAKRGAESILRDKLAAMVVDRYDHLQVLAAVALGKRKADDLLPALRSAVTLGSGATEAGQPAAPVPIDSPA